MILPSWSNLENMIPKELEERIGEVTRFGKSVSLSVHSNIDLQFLDKHKQKLIMASADLETMILNVSALLSDTEELCKTDLDKGLLAYLKDDLARFVSFVDEKQNQLLEIPDGETSGGISKTTAFRKVLKVALDLIYYSLYEASREYDKIRPIEERKINMFLRILFYVLSMKLSVSGGIARKSTSFLKKTQLPSSWRGLFTKEGAESLSEGLKDEYDKEFPLEEGDIIENIEGIEKLRDLGDSEEDDDNEDDSEY